MNSQSIRTIAALAALLAPFVGNTAEIRTLTEDCEIALALSAAPLHLRDNAGVYVLGSQGFELARVPANGFRCLVERNHSDSIIPQCLDETSSDANLAAILDAGKWLRDGDTFETVAARRLQALESGRYASAGHGLVYMISDYNYIYDARDERMLHVGPHLMFHAPNLTDADIGADAAAAMANRGLPMINAPGPHGFVVSFVEKPSDSGAVRKACDGQLPDPVGLQTFPAPPTDRGD